MDFLNGGVYERERSHISIPEFPVSEPVEIEWDDAIPMDDNPGES